MVASVEYWCSDLRWCYLQQTVHFFQSDRNAVVPNKLAFTYLHCSISSCTLKGLRSNTPLHKHNSDTYELKAFVICDRKSDQTRSATRVNQTYLVWLMYWLLFNQYYQHSHQSEAAFVGERSFSKSWGLWVSVSFSSLPLPCHSFFVAVVPTFSTNLCGNTCYAG